MNQPMKRCLLQVPCFRSVAALLPAPPLNPKPKRLVALVCPEPPVTISPFQSSVLAHVAQKKWDTLS